MRSKMPYVRQLAHRSRPRPPPRAWVGGMFNQTMTANIVYYSLLWDPSVDPQYYNLQGHGTHLATHLDLNFQTPGTVSVISYGVIVLPTDNALAVPAAIIPAPDAAGSLDKPWLDYGQWYLQATASMGFQSSQHRFIRTRRRLDDTEALVLILVSSVTNVVSRSISRTLMKLE